MKFWELVSVCGEEPELIERLAARSEWAGYLEWYRDLTRLAREQDREKLDAELPDEACVYVLSASRTEYFESADHIRMRRHSPDDRLVTALEILKRYGGSYLELVHEGGLARIPGC